MTMSKLLRRCLPEGVSTVDDTVVSGHESTAVTGKVDSQVVEVVNGTETLLWSVVDPDTLLSIESWDTVEGGVHVTW